MNYEKLDQKMLEMKEDIFQSIRESVAIESVKGEPEENAPYGRGPKEALDHMLALGEKLGFKTKNVDDRAGWIEFGEGEEMVGVLGHVDIVPLGEGWDYDPLGCEVHDGKMFGRGILDDKGPVVGAVYALKAIRDLELPIDRRIRVIFGADEENGSSCMEHYIAVGEENPTIGFTPDGDYPVIFFEKGMTPWKVEKEVVNPSTVKVLSIQGGTASNVVTPTCTMVVEGDFELPESKGITVTKEDGKTIVFSEGKGAHGSTPELGVNAAIQLFQALKDNGIDLGGDLQSMINFVMDKINTETNGKSLGIDFVSEETGNTSVNFGVIDCTEEKLSFTLDIRYSTAADRETLIANVREAIEAYGLTGILGEGAQPLYVPKDSELVQKLMSVYEAETGRKEEPLAIGGGTYAKEFKNMVAFGPIFPGEDVVIHQPNEGASIESLMKSFQIVAAAMYELAQK